MERRSRFLKALTAPWSVKALRGAALSWILALAGSLGNLFAANPDTLNLKFRVDTIPPYAISDLVAQQVPGSEGEVTLNWTEPGDDGFAGQANQYLVRFSTHGNIENSTDFSTATVYNSGWTPGPGAGGMMNTVDKLLPGVTYYFAIRAQDRAGLQGTWSRAAGTNAGNFAATWDQPPSPLQGVTALAGNERINLSWTHLTLPERTTDFDYYRVYRSTNLNFVPFVISSQTLINSFADTNVLDFATYYYRVVGVDKGIESTPVYYGHALESVSWSTVSTRGGLPAPSAFTNISVTTDTIVWQWIDNSSVETGFRIISSTGGVIGSTGSLAGTGGVMQWTESGLVPGGQYQRYVVAYGTGIQSSPSASSSKYTLPNPPLNFHSSTQAVNSVLLNWDANNNSALVNYTIERATYPLNTYISYANTTQNYFAPTALIEYTTYTFRLTATNGEGAASSQVSINTVTIAMPPSEINTLTASPGSVEGTINLFWLAPGDDGTSGNIMGGQYDIRWSTDVMATDADYQAALYRRVISTNTAYGAQQGVAITGLSAGSMVYFAIKTRDEIADNYSPMSNVATSLVQADVSSPSVVTSLHAVRLSSDSIRLSWIAPGDDGTRNANLFGSYDIRLAASSMTTLASFLSAASVTGYGAIPAPASTGTLQTMDLLGLPLDTTFYFRMRTLDEAGNASPISNSTTSFTLDTVPPGPVQNFAARANQIIGRRIDLSWTNPSAADLRGVRIIYSTEGFAATPSTTGVTYVDLASTGTVPSSYSQSALEVGVTYYYTIFAFDDEVARNFSTAASSSAWPISTALARPGKPRNLLGQRMPDANMFTVRWEAPLANSDGSPIGANDLTGYAIYRMPALYGATDQMVLTVSSQTFYIDTGVLGHLYYYKVRARNIAGVESDDSDILGMPTDVVVPEGDIYIMMDDEISYIKLPSSMRAQLNNINVELTGNREPAGEGGKVFKSVNVNVSDRITGLPKKGYVFDRPVQVSIAYIIDGNGNVAAAAPALLAQKALASEKPLPASYANSSGGMSVYWHNGVDWVKLGTQVDPANQNASVQTRLSGAYQLRLVNQATIQHNSVYPKTITPNGDGINDIVFFFFENATGAPVRGTIYDMRSAKVGSVRESNILSGGNSVLTWDGTDDNGSAVPGGVYTYKLEVGDQTYTGTIAVAH